SACSRRGWGWGVFRPGRTPSWGHPPADSAFSLLRPVGNASPLRSHNVSSLRHETTLRRMVMAKCPQCGDPSFMGKGYMASGVCRGCYEARAKVSAGGAVAARPVEAHGEAC